jgi:GSCFA family
LVWFNDHKMEFRTELKSKPSSTPIEYTHRLLMLGSCFSQNVGEWLQMYKFNCTINPFGTIFNPISIAKLIDRSIEKKWIAPEELGFQQGLYYHFDFHSKLSDANKLLCSKKINDKILATHYTLSQADFIFITLGTSIVFANKDNDQIVANCHKVDSSSFNKKMLSVADCVDSLGNAIIHLQSFNPRLNIVFTVSPVRHIKDGIVENSRSKSTLIQSIMKLEQCHPNISYFPAFEWMMDDLRDYRFYGSDLIHPNDVGIDYIKEKFVETYFQEKTLSNYHKISKILKMIAHKPLNPSSEDTAAHLQKVRLNIQELEKEYPDFDFKW